MFSVYVYAVCKNLKQNITAIIGPLSDQTIEIVQSIAKYVSIPHIYPAYVPHGTVMEDIDDSTSYNIYPDLHLLSEVSINNVLQFSNTFNGIYHKRLEYWITDIIRFGAGPNYESVDKHRDG